MIILSSNDPWRYNYSRIHEMQIIILSYYEKMSKLVVSIIISDDCKTLAIDM